MTTHLTDGQKSQIRTGLATWVGWTNIKWEDDDDCPGMLLLIGKEPSQFKAPREVPNYPDDLNACQAIEVKLDRMQYSLFRLALLDVCDERVISASAEHRSLALFRALNLGELGD